ncbi:MAG TPA: VOC family protein [Kouleothrix sp.]|uniref:VOC family protein n=1 Tax=Kouleothrix sp. TaxID=2779161 RepID=UPI002CBC58E4|nr:VOC family protein [Kouleothrix sp.]HRC74863.1 VOC family protein [Kouleothrix sp.]
MAEATIALGPLGQIALTVADLAAATEFYRERLGLPFLFAAPNLAFFDCGGVRLMLATPERGEAVAQGATLYFTVGDIHAAHRALAQRGVPFVDAPHLIADMGSYELWMAFFHDPDAHLLGIMAELPKE